MNSRMTEERLEALYADHSYMQSWEEIRELIYEIRASWKEIAELKTENTTLEAELEDYMKYFKEDREENTKLKAQVEELEKQPHSESLPGIGRWICKFRRYEK